MRIISGNLKGRKINFIKNKTTRPLTDRVKENIFNLLNHSNNLGIKLENKNILDAYSGVGSFGLECISRGVKKVDFIEKDYVAYQILIKNIKDLCLEKNYDTENIDLEKFLNFNKKKQYDIIFFDPPFEEILYLNNLKIIHEQKMFTKNNLLIIHREKNHKEIFPRYIKLILTRDYGRSRVYFGTFL